MNIGIDARVLEKGITGIGRYLEGILNGLHLVDNRNKYYLFSYNNLNISPHYYVNISTGNPFISDKIFSPLWLNYILPKYLMQYKIDVLFTPNQILPLKKIIQKTIITVHDIAHKVDKNYHPFFYRFYMDIFLSSSIKKSNKILSISAYTKKSIENNYKVASGKISVIYQTADKKFLKKNVTADKREILKRKFNLPKTFILYVGMIENRKNIYGILQISDIIKKKDFPIEFVFIGKQGHRFNNIYREISSRPYIHYLENISDEELIDMYNLAFAFIFPSFFEGFGLPPLEAMQSGLPVLVSNRASLPEVVGEAGIVKEPDDYIGFANEIIKMYENPAYYSKLRNKSLERALNFNYLDSIKAFVTVINDLSKD